MILLLSSARGKSIKQIMAPGALDPLTKELIYVAVSMTNQCWILHRIAYHIRAEQRYDRRNVSRTDGGRRNGE